MSLKENEFNSELQELYAAKDYDGVIRKVNAAYDGAIPEQFEKWLALSYYYQSDYTNALLHFQNLAARDESTENLFNVMMSLLAMKNTDKARPVFQKLISTHRGAASTGQGKDFMPQLSVPYIRYYYACGLVDAGNYGEAEIQLEELKKVYTGAKITDDTYLYIRGVPFFGDTLSLAEKVYVGQGKDFKHSQFLRDLASSVDKEGRAAIKRYR